MTLSCELSKPGLSVEWKKGQELLKNNFKYQIKNRNCIMEITIKNSQLEDSGLYSCNYGDVKTTANITITRKRGPKMHTYMAFYIPSESRDKNRKEIVVQGETARTVTTKVLT